jgi:hypothetical protein
MKKAKAWFGSPVQQVLYALHATHPWNTRNRREVEGFCQGGEELLKRLNELEACRHDQVACHIKRVIRVAYRLTKATDFDQVFSGITEKELNPTTRTGFINRLAKLARYQECCLYLCQTAKQSGLFKDADVVVVSLDAHLFTKTLSVPPECCLEDCLSRCESSAPFPFGAENIIARLLDSNKDNSDFLSAVRKALRESCVHAEVQLVCYYELYPVAWKPRIICSSKDACYLCNLFIQLDGSFKIPKAHNNIYAGWRLLPFPALDRVLSQLNDLLEARIRELLVIIMRNKSLRLPLPQNPNESTVFQFSTALPTTASSVITVEASGSAAVEAEEVNDTQLGFLEGEDALDLERSDSSSAQTPTSTGTRDSASPDPNIPTGSQPVSPERQPSAPKLLNRTSPGTSDSLPSMRGTAHELTREVSGLAGEPDELARDPSEHPGVGKKAGSLQQLEPNQQPEAAPGPEPGPTFGFDVQPEQKSKSDHEPKPELESAGLPEPVLESRRTPDPEPGLEPVMPRPTPEAGIIIPQTSLNPGPSLNANPNDNQRQHHTKSLCHLHLTRDQPLSLRLDTTTTTTRNRTIPALTAGQITILPELIRSLGGQSRSVVEVQVHWLPRRRAAAFYVARPRGFVDLERCDEGVEIDGGCSECVYVAYGGEVVVLDFVRG